MSNYQLGQAILGRLPFKNTNTPSYARPYLIVKIFKDKLGIIDVSSSEGKEHKLLFEFNHALTNYKPPFRKPSFVKIDSYREVDVSEISNIRILSNGECLKEDELANITQHLAAFLKKEDDLSDNCSP